MKIKVLLIISAVYMLLVGAGHLAAPIAMSAGVFSSGASPEISAFLRHYSALFLAVSIMNWMARDAEASPARNAIITANIIIYGFGAVLDIVASFTGTGLVGLAPASINLIFALAFIWGGGFTKFELVTN